MGSLREGWASAALSSAIGAENRPLDVLVSVQQHACPCQPAMFAIGGRPPCALRKRERSSISASRGEPSGVSRHATRRSAEPSSCHRFYPPQCPTAFPAPKSANWRSCKRIRRAALAIRKALPQERAGAGMVGV